MVMGSPGSASTDHSVTPSNPVEKALFTPVILDLVFHYLDLISLKKCRQVCWEWSEIAKPYKHPDCVVRIPNVLTNEGLEKLLAELERSIVPWGVHYEVYLDQPRLPQILDRIQGKVEILRFISGTCPVEKISFEDSTFQLLNLKTLVVELGPNTGGTAEEREAWAQNSCLAVFDTIQRARNLLELKIDPCSSLARRLVNMLMASNASATRERLSQTLESLTLCLLVAVHRDMEDLRSLHLQLKHLKLVYCYGGRFPLLFPRFVLNWLKYMKATLESVSLRIMDSSGRGIWPLQYLTFVEMPYLKRLEIHMPADQMNNLVRVLECLPNLEILILEETNWTGVQRVDFFGNNWEAVSFPRVKEFRLKTVGFKAADCPPSYYVPRLFPRLKKLSMAVYSQNSLLVCMHEMKKSGIEELELGLDQGGRYAEFSPRTDVITGRTRWGSGLPTFSNWKQLKKLTLDFKSCVPSWLGRGRHRVEQRNKLSEVYGMQLEDILPGNLTSLELLNLGVQGLVWDEAYFIKILEGLPLLINIKISTGEKTLIRIPGKRSSLLKKIRRNRSTHTCLSVQIVGGEFYPEKDSNNNVLKE